MSEADDRRFNCQYHGDPDDHVYCLNKKCQLGRIPQWFGNGLPAGTRPCEFCDGRGVMTRRERDLVDWPSYDDRFVTTEYRCQCDPEQSPINLVALARETRRATT